MTKTKIKLSVIQHLKQWGKYKHRCMDGTSDVESNFSISIYMDTLNIYRSTLKVIEYFINANHYTTHWNGGFDHRENGIEVNEFSIRLTQQLSTELIKEVDEIETVEEVDISSYSKDCDENKIKIFEDTITILSSSSKLYKVPVKKVYETLTHNGVSIPTSKWRYEISLESLSIVDDQKIKYAELQNKYNEQLYALEKDFRFNVISKTSDCCIDDKNPLLDNCYPLDIAYNYKDNNLFCELIKKGAKVTEQLYPILMWQCQLKQTENILYFYKEYKDKFDFQIKILLMRDAIATQNYDLVSFLSDKVDFQKEYEHISFDEKGKFIKNKKDNWYKGYYHEYIENDGKRIGYQRYYKDLKPIEGLQETVIENYTSIREINIDLIYNAFALGDSKIIDIFLEQGNKEVILQKIKKDEFAYYNSAVKHTDFFCNLLRKGIVIINDNLLGKIINYRQVEIIDFLLKNEHFLNNCSFHKDESTVVYLLREAVFAKNYSFVSYLSTKIDYSKNYRVWSNRVEEYKYYYNNNFGSIEWKKGEIFDAISLSCLAGDVKILDIFVQAGADVHKNNYLEFLVRNKETFYRHSSSYYGFSTSALNREDCAYYLWKNGLSLDYTYYNINLLIEQKYKRFLEKILNKTNIEQVYSFRKELFNRLIESNFPEYAEKLLIKWSDSIDTINSIRPDSLNKETCESVADWLIKYENPKVDLFGKQGYVMEYNSYLKKNCEKYHKRLLIHLLEKNVDFQKMNIIISRCINANYNTYSQIKDNVYANIVYQMIDLFKNESYKSLENKMVADVFVDDFKTSDFFYFLFRTHLFPPIYFTIAKKLLLMENVFEKYEYDKKEEKIIDTNYSYIEQKTQRNRNSTITIIKEKAEVKNYNYTARWICNDIQKILIKITANESIAEEDKNIIINLCNKAISDNKKKELVEVIEKRSERKEDDWEYTQNDYDSMYRDAFDGNEDAYWNID